MRILLWDQKDVYEILMKQDIATDEILEYGEAIQKYLHITGKKIQYH